MQISRPGGESLLTWGPIEDRILYVPGPGVHVGAFPLEWPFDMKRFSVDSRGGKEVGVNAMTTPCMQGQIGIIMKSKEGCDLPDCMSVAITLFEPRPRSKSYRRRCSLEGFSLGSKLRASATHNGRSGVPIDTSSTKVSVTLLYLCVGMFHQRRQCS